MRTLCWVLWGALGGCASPHGPEVDASYDSYGLESVDSESVPTLTVASGSIRLNFDGTFVERMRYASGGLSGNFTYTGFFSRLGDTVELRYADGIPAIIDTAFVAAEAMVRRDCDRWFSLCRSELVYRLDR